MLSLTGKIKSSSLFPQYLITAMFVGVCAVVNNTHFWPANSLEIAMEATLADQRGQRIGRISRGGERTENAGNESTERKRSEICGGRKWQWGWRNYRLEVEMGRRAGGNCWVAGVSEIENLLSVGPTPSCLEIATPLSFYLLMINCVYHVHTNVTTWSTLYHF